MAADVTLQWDANTETDLAGYKVYVGTASRTYGTPFTIGTQTTYSVTNLQPGTYYFAVTALNSSGLESDYSNEVSTTIVPASTSNCDNNHDGTINAIDLQTLINHILTASQLSSVDVNKDTRIDVLDLQILSNVILGQRSCP
jgi:hypothetical protein